MDRIKQIEHELNGLQFLIAAQQERKKKLREERRQILAKRWIEKHGVTRDQVILSDGGDVPYFASFTDFGAWLARNNISTPYLEWNGMILKTEDAKANLFDHHSVARLSDLPE